jgi:hypothetical protein
MALFTGIIEWYYVYFFEFSNNSLFTFIKILRTYDTYFIYGNLVKAESFVTDETVNYCRVLETSDAGLVR